MGEGLKNLQTRINNTKYDEENSREELVDYMINELDVLARAYGVGADLANLHVYGLLITLEIDNPLEFKSSIELCRNFLINEYKELEKEW